MAGYLYYLKKTPLIIFILLPHGYIFFFLFLHTYHHPYIVFGIKDTTVNY